MFPVFLMAEIPYNIPMKHILIFFSLLTFMGCSVKDIREGEASPEVRDVSPRARNNDNIRKRVLILPFINMSPYPSLNAEEIAESTLRRRLRSTGEIIVLNPSQIPHDLSKFIDKDNEYDLKKILPLARKIGAHGIVIGRIKELKTKKIGDSVGFFRKVQAEVSTLVDLRMISAKSSSNMVHEIRTAKIQDEVTRVAKYSYTDKELQDNPTLIEKVVTAAFSKMIRPIVLSLRKLNWEGRVALIRGERIFLNAGRISGLQVGDILQVTEGREEVFDPETGAYIGKIRGRLKGTVEVIAYFGKDGAVTNLHSGSGFEPNDIVEFY